MSNNLNFKETMSTPKFHACDEPGCERLTSGEMCDLHCEDEVAIDTQAQINADARLTQINGGEEKSRQWEERADKIDTMRAELAELRGPEQRTNNQETPTFSNHTQENNYE